MFSKQGVGTYRNKRANFFLFLFPTFLFLNFYSAPLLGNELVDLSKSFLQNLIEEKAIDQALLAYEKMDMDKLIKGLNSEEEKLAFWINTYNAFIIYELRKDPGRYKNKGSFFW